MSDTRNPERTTSPRPILVAAVCGVVVGLAVYLVGLPSSLTVFDVKAADLTVYLALFLAIGTTTVVATALSGSRWRVVDIVVASVLGVAGGLLFTVWNAVAWEPISGALAFFPPASAVATGLWLLPGVLGGLIVRRPGAAVYTELLAALISAYFGNQWGFATVWYGLLEGLGVEVVFAVLLYRAFGMPAALAAGAGGGLTLGILDSLVYFPTFSALYKIVYILLAMLSATVIAGLGGWALTRALAATGALAPLPSGRVAERV
jgi:energy-coupling factor transport system substrate-specific component